MRKIILAFTLLLFVCALYDGGGAVFADAEGVFTVCAGESSSSKMECVDKEAYIALAKSKTLGGQSVSFSDTEYMNKIVAKLRAKKLFCESAGDIVTEYYYTPRIRNFVVIKGRKVNLQIAYGKENCCVGTPVIFGGY